MDKNRFYFSEKQIQKLKATYQAVIGADIVKDPVKWVRDNVKSPESARSSSVDLSLTPYLIEPFETAVRGCNERSEPIHTVSILGNTGSGKSTFYTAYLNYVLSHRPAPSAVVFQNMNESVTFGESRLFPSMKSNPKLAAVYPDDKKHAGKFRIDLCGTPLYLLSATKGQLQSKSLTNLILDEVWCWQPSMIGEAVRRTHDRQNRMIIAVSQGGIMGEEWQKFHDQGLQKVFAWRCPDCQKLVEYNWQNLKFDRCVDEESGKMDLIGFEDSVRMICPFCNAEFPDTVTNRRRLAENGVYIPHHDNSKLQNHVSFNYNVLACYWVKWSEVILEFLQANDHLKETDDRSRLNQFLQKRLAMNINLKIEDENAEKITCFKQLHRKIQVPKIIEGIEIKRLLSVDVQGDGFYFSVYAYCTDCKLYLLDAGKVKTYTELEEIQTIYKVEKGDVVIDCGYNTNETIYEANSRYWYPVNCTSSNSFTHILRDKNKEMKVELLYSKPQKTNINGKFCNYLKFSSRGLKEFTYQQFIKKKRVIIYDDIDKFFIRSLTAEVRIPYKDNNTQSIRYKWESKQNISHYWDCLIMCVGLLQVRKYIKETP